MSKIKLIFLGGATTVTGSKTLIECDNKKILIDCGLFQGLKFLRLKNWEKFPINIQEIDCIILTHAHLDHSGYLPVLVKNGFNGKIYCTTPTKELTEIILKDSAKIQEEDANRANKHKYSKHATALPLYTIDDAEKTVRKLENIKRDTWIKITKNIKFKFTNSGHIIGSGYVEIEIFNKRILFSGDIGRLNPLLLYPPNKDLEVDVLIMESTYGNRIHNGVDYMQKLCEVIIKVVERKGILMIPSFAVERAQEIIYLIYKLKKEGKLPQVPIFLDSPMGIKSSEVFMNHPEWQKISNEEIKNMFENIEFVDSREKSKILVQDNTCKIVIAGSGMLEGGRILHYMLNQMSNPNNMLLFVGFQALGTRGRNILDGKREIKFFGEMRKINCEVEQVSGFSGHADQSELLKWLEGFKKIPERIFLNHGEIDQSSELKGKIKEKYNINCDIPELEESFDI